MPPPPPSTLASWPYLTTEFGNASSIYSLGRHAMQAIDHSREEVAEILNCRPTELAFVGCGSESGTVVFLSTHPNRHIGVQLQTTPFFRGLTVAENLIMFAHFYGVQLTAQQVNALLTRCGLAESARTEAPSSHTPA